MKKFLFLAVLLAGMSAAQAQTSYGALLGGHNEVPPVSSAGVGVGILTLQPGNEFVYTINYIFLGTGVTAAHIHHGAIDAAGPVIIGFEPTLGTTFGNIAGTTRALTAEELGWLAAGELYLNIHTVNNPGGEIRGQIVADPIPEPATLALAGLGLAALAWRARRKS